MQKEAGPDELAPRGSQHIGTELMLPRGLAWKLIPRQRASSHWQINSLFLWNSSWIRTAKGNWLLSHQFPVGLTGAFGWTALQAGASWERCL